MTRIDPRRAASRTRLAQLAGPRGSGLESGGDPVPDLSRARIGVSLDALEERLARTVVENPATPLGDEAADLVAGAAERGLRKLADAGEDADLQPIEASALEAVVHSDGSRPSLLVQDGFVDASDPRIGDWRDELAMSGDAIRRAIASTGRLLVNGDTDDRRVYGTAWMIAPGFAATAQHVLELMFRKHVGEWVPNFGAAITLDFAVEADRPARPEDRLRVTGVERASPDLIGGRLDLGNLDAAILRLEDTGPAPLTLARGLETSGPPQIHVVGHPSRQSAADRPDIAPDAAMQMTLQVLDLVFGDAFGVKRWSPGLIVIGPGTLQNDVHDRVMTHDASTLTGNSGSPVLDLTDFPDRAAGLHYGGAYRKENYAHPCGAIRTHLEIPGAVFV